METNLNREKNKEFYIACISLVIPLMLQSILSYSVTTVDSIMLGSLSETAMSAANIANQPFYIVSGLVRGLGIGAGILIAQYWGRKEYAVIQKIVVIAAKINMAFSFVCAAFVFALPGQVMSFFTSDADIRNEGIFYLRILSVTFVLYAISMTYQLAVRSMEDARTPLIINIITYAVNIFLNYCFLFGRFGFPEMGITGVAIGTLAARIVELLCCLVHNLVMNKYIRITLPDIFAKDKKLQGEMIKFGTPNMMSELVYTLGMSMYTMIFGHLGANATAANTVATMRGRIGETMLCGVAGAAAVLIGKTIGEKDIGEVFRRSNTFIKMSAVTAAAASLITYALRNWIISLYSLSDETYEMAARMILVVVAIQIGYAYECLFVTGILVAGGDTKFIFIFTTCVMWLVTIPCARAAAFIFNAPAWVVFLILKCDYFIKGIIGFIRYRSKKWLKYIAE